jgi:mono/diheme cytochrome c family protein
MQNWKKKILKTRARAMKKDEEQAKKDIAEEEADFDKISAWLAQQRLPPGRRDAKLDQVAPERFADRCGSCHSIQGKGGKTAPDLTGYGSEEWVRLMILAPNHPQRYGPKNEMPLFRDKQSLTWPLQLAQIEQDREALLKTLLEDVGKEAEASSPPAPGLAFVAVPDGLAPVPLSLTAAAVSLKVAADQEAEVRKKTEAVRAQIRQQVRRATEVSPLTNVERELIIRCVLRDYRVVFGGEPITGPRKR